MMFLFTTKGAGAMATYTTVGPVRGCCGHHHRTIKAAADCCRRDQSGCKSQGGYSDRSLRVIEDGERRQPTESEYLDFSDRLANH